MDCIHQDKCLYYWTDRTNCEGCRYYEKDNRNYGEHKK